MATPEMRCARCQTVFMDRTEFGEHVLNAMLRACPIVTPPPTPKRADPGGDLQKLITMSAKALGGEGLKLKHHRPQQVRGKQVWHKAPVDYTGDCRGRAVAFDAKSTAGSFLPVSDLKKRQHQLDQIRDAHGRGGVAFYLVELRGAPGGPRYFALPWPVLRPYVEGGAGRQSIPLDVFVARCPEVVRAGRLLDLVKAIAAVGALAEGGAA